MYWELRCCGGKSHILTIQHRISKIAENSLVKLGIWLPYNSSLSRSTQPRQTYSPGFTNGRTDRKLRQAINPSAAMLRSGLKNAIHEPNFCNVLYIPMAYRHWYDNVFPFCANRCCANEVGTHKTVVHPIDDLQRFYFPMNTRSPDS